jgi:hypothetical protein
LLIEVARVGFAPRRAPCDGAFETGDELWRGERPAGALRAAKLSSSAASGTGNFAKSPTRSSKGFTVTRPSSRPGLGRSTMAQRARFLLIFCTWQE